MTAQTATPAGRWRRVSPVDVVLGAILTFVLVAGFKGAFQHMHDWTVHELGSSSAGWVNAIISELMPTAAFLLIQKARTREQSIAGPMLLFWASAFLSLVANLTATQWYPPGGKQLLAILPMLAVMVLGEMILRDVVRSGKEKAARLAEAEHAAELARRRAEQAAELQAEQARNFARQQAELQAEQVRADREHAAELDRQRLAIEQAALTERARIEAAERAEERRARQQLEERELRARLDREAEATRIAAEADAEKVKAEAERIRVEASLKEQTATLLTVPRSSGRHRTTPAADADGGNVRTMRTYRRREDSERIVAVALAGAPSGTTRDEAVKLAAAALDITERQARKFVPAEWSSGSSAGGEAEDVA